MKTLTLALIVGLFVCATGFNGAALGQSWPAATAVHINVADYVLDSIVQVQISFDDEARNVGSGLVVRSDGLILTANHLVKGAANISIRLRNGETFDRAEIVATDERRNVAIIRIPAANLTALSPALLEEGLVGSAVALLSATGPHDGAATGLLSSVALADEIPGAGSGYRILKFTAPVSNANSGGLLIDSYGHPIGLLAAAPQAQTQSYAVPLSSLTGLIRSIGIQQSTWTAPASSQTTPVPIPQSSVSVPQRPVSALAAKGPGSVVIKSSRTVDILRDSKTIFVQSLTDNFKPDQLVNEMVKKPELNEWGLSFVDEREVADLVLTIDHILFTWKFTFKLAHQRTGIVVAAGDVIIWDGNLGAPHMADRIIEKLTKVKAQTPTPVPTNETKK